jgi:cell division protein FtsQ
MVNKRTIVNWMLTSLWIAMGAGTIVLLIAGIKRKDAQRCSSINITIEGVDNNFFVDKKDILNSITAFVGGNPVGKTISAFDLRKLEKLLGKDIWIKTSQLFFDNNNRLMVKVVEREPMARVFTSGATTFYIDSSLTMLPLSEKFSARLPVFTGFPSDKLVLSTADSSLLKDILTVSMAIQKDPFSMALIDQVDITRERNFEMVPKIGNTIIVFGDATNVEEKLNKLQMFYRQVMGKAGWNKYSTVNVQYSGQVVAKRKGAEDKSTDSLRTLQLMQAIAENTERESNDSLHMIAQDNENNTTDVDLVQHSIQRDDEREPAAGEGSGPVTPPVKVRPTASKPVLTAVSKEKVLPVKNATTKKVNTDAKHGSTIIKQTTKPAKTNTEIPKAVMPKPTKKANNEY